jgi:ribosomal protein L24
MGTSVGTTFRKGDEVVLVEGTYQGTLGIFVRLKKDINWVDISEHNGRIRSHPVAWLGHSAGPVHGSAN